MKKLPGKTVERLSGYRRMLLDCLRMGDHYIYSHELADLLHITAVQVRRDLMLIGYSSVQRKGYDIRALVDTIGKILDRDEGQNVAVVGIGNLGMAITGYFTGKRSKLNIVASFDTDPQKVNRVISGVKCYPAAQMQQRIKELQIHIAILTVPMDFAAELSEQLVDYGIRGIMNFTTVPLNVPEHVHLEEYDMITSLEKVAYFVKENQ